MKRNPDFLLNTVAGKQVLVPVGKAAVKFPGMVSVNNTGAYIWELLENEMTMDAVIAEITTRYDVSAEIAQKDAALFIERLRSVKAIID